jgi:hypothetical protein
MNRREALKRVATLTGGALSPSLVSAVLSGCKSSDVGNKWTPKIVTPEQNDLITMVAELIIPETDTPGAKAAGVNEFIDLMLADWFTLAERNHFVKGLTDLDARAQQNHSKTFVKCTSEEQTTILEHLERESLAYRDSNPSQDDQNNVLRPFFSQMKELTLTGYYTSEIGATQELKYFEAAVSYDGCVPFDENGRAWSAP